MRWLRRRIRQILAKRRFRRRRARRQDLNTPSSPTGGQNDTGDVIRGADFYNDGTTGGF
ncbi:hypothetical protein ACIBHY_19995 [Nonomuraea sp. NPDC050547]|uniref:hypothetical protein n=1 Tax=unclassified Nonomuraea TaxID=2593643 RepID=UPI00367A0341